MKRLDSSPIKMVRLIEDARNGETLSVRISFEWEPNKSPLDFGVIVWWEVLEVDEFDRIFPN